MALYLDIIDWVRYFTAAILWITICGCDLKNKDNTNADAPALTVSKSTISAKPILPNLARTISTTVSNKSVYERKITGITLPNIPFTLLSPTSFPVTVAPFGSIEVTIEFKSSAVGSYNSSVVIVTDDPVNQLIPVVLSGVSSYGTSNVYSGLFLDGTFGEPVIINDKKLAVVSVGPDNAIGTADDKLLLIDEGKSAPDEFPGVSYLASRPIARWYQPHTLGITISNQAPGGSKFAVLNMNTLTKQEIAIPGLLSISPCRPIDFGSLAILPSAGVDNTFGTADDAVYIVKIEETLLTAVPISVPFMSSTKISTQVFSFDRFHIATPLSNKLNMIEFPGNLGIIVPDDSLTTKSFITMNDLDNEFSVPLSWRYKHVVLARKGLDNVAGTSDDIITRVNYGVAVDFMVLSSGAPNVISQIYNASRRVEAHSIWAIVLSRGPASLSPGFDATGQEKIYLVKLINDATTVPEVIEISAGGLVNESLSEPVFEDLSDKSLLVTTSTAGPDNKKNTSDDQVKVVRIFPKSNSPFEFNSSTTTTLTVPNLNSIMSIPTIVRNGIYAVSTLGPDGLDGTGDESIYYFDPAKGYLAKEPTLFSLRQAKACKPVRITNNKYVITTAGGDGIFGTGNEQVIFITIPEE